MVDFAFNIVKDEFNHRPSDEMVQGFHLNRTTELLPKHV